MVKIGMINKRTIRDKLHLYAQVGLIAAFAAGSIWGVPRLVNQIRFGYKMDAANAAVTNGKWTSGWQEINDFVKDREFIMPGSVEKNVAEIKKKIQEAKYNTFLGDAEAKRSYSGSKECLENLLLEEPYLEEAKMALALQTIEELHPKYILDNAEKASVDAKIRMYRAAENDYSKMGEKNHVLNNKLANSLIEKVIEIERGKEINFSPFGELKGYLDSNGDVEIDSELKSVFLAESIGHLNRAFFVDDKLSNSNIAYIENVRDIASKIKAPDYETKVKELSNLLVDRALFKMKNDPNPDVSNVRYIYDTVEISKKECPERIPELILAASGLEIRTSEEDKKEALAMVTRYLPLLADDMRSAVSTKIAGRYVELARSQRDKKNSVEMARIAKSLYTEAGLDNSGPLVKEADEIIDGSYWEKKESDSSALMIPAGNK